MIFAGVREVQGRPARQGLVCSPFAISGTIPTSFLH
jgi:hypothetical protein